MSPLCDTVTPRWRTHTETDLYHRVLILFLFPVFLVGVRSSTVDFHHYHNTGSTEHFSLWKFSPAWTFSTSVGVLKGKRPTAQLKPPAVMKELINVKEVLTELADSSEQGRAVSKYCKD